MIFFLQIFWSCILYSSFYVGLTNKKSDTIDNVVITESIDTISRELVWQDDFSYGTKKDLFKIWTPEHNPAPHTLSSRWMENIEIVDDNVRLNNKKETRGGQSWTSGSMHTKQNFLYGYFECRYKYAKSKGTNNSFWFINTSDTIKNGRKFEIDVNEGRYPNKVKTNIHDWSNENSTQNSKTYSSEEIDLGEDFHTYGLEWNEKELVFYVDGKEIRREVNDFCHTASPIYISCAIIPWDGQINEGRLNGTFMEIDYIKVYKPKK